MATTAKAVSWDNGRMWWINARKAFDQFRKWSAIKALLDLAGVWKWVVLGASVVGGFLLPLFSKLDPALRVLVLLLAIALALASTLFLVALRRVTKNQRVDAENDPVVLHDRPKKHHIALAAVLVLLAVVGAVWGPRIKSPVSAPPPPTRVIPSSGPQMPEVPAALTNAVPEHKRVAQVRKVDAPSHTRTAETKEASAAPQVYGTQHVESGGIGYQANGPNPRIDIHPTVPARALIPTMSDTDVLALRDALAVSSGKPIDISLDGSNADDVLAFSNALVKAIAQAHITIGSFYGDEIGGGIVNADGVAYPCKHPGITFQFGHDRSGDYSILSAKLKNLDIIDTINSCGSSDPEQLKVFISRLN